MSSTEETFHIFNVESEKLVSSISSALVKSEFSISEIVQIYYQITNVTSLGTILKQQIKDSDEHHSMTRKIEEIEKLISEKFNSNLHVSILAHLTKSVTEITKNLGSGTMEKSKEEIESEAKLYEKLRQTMSTKEFVQQYDKGLSHD